MKSHQSNRIEKINDKKSFSKKSTSVILSIYFGINLLLSGCTSTEKSKPAEVEAQKEFQAKVMKEEKEFKQKVEALAREAENASKFDLTPSSGLNAQIEFQQKMEVETTKPLQAPDSTLKGL